MQRGRLLVGGGRVWRGLLCVAALGALSGALSGCDWLFGDSTPIAGQKPRPGAERQIAPGAALPAPGASQGYDSSLVPVDETRQTQIGSIIQGKGGQKAQKDAADKESAERDAKAREDREKREAADKEAKEKEKEADKDKGQSGPPPQAGVPSKPAAAERGNIDTGDRAPPAAPAAPAAGPAGAPAVPLAPGSPAAPGAGTSVPPAPAPAPGNDQSPASPRT
jgi:hypothetical protein